MDKSQHTLLKALIEQVRNDDTEGANETTRKILKLKLAEKHSTKGEE
jgi:hypothetical protein